MSLPSSTALGSPGHVMMIREQASYLTLHISNTAPRTSSIERVKTSDPFNLEVNLQVFSNRPATDYPALGN